LTKEYWITNISKRNITLSDLGISVPRETCVNLLSKNYYLKPEQIEKSVSSGSIFKKRDKILSNTKPREPEIKRIELSSRPVLRPPRSIAHIEVKEFEELIISDEKFADEYSSDEE